MISSLASRAGLDRSAVLANAFLASKRRILVGLAVVGAAAVGLAGVAHPLWSAVLLGLLAPWLVLGRDAARVRAGVREGIRMAPGCTRWVLAELAPPLAVVAVGALVAARGMPLVSLCLFVWGAALVTLADALDRRSARAASAWMALLVPCLILLTAPLWAAGWFSAPGLGHWPASLAIALHPAGMVVSATGHAALQDPVFYRWTLSGVVEARPLAWWVGACFHGGLALLGAYAATRAARRPTPSRVGPADVHRSFT